MLRNQTYIGNLVQGKETSISYKNHKRRRIDKSNWSIKENTHEPIIDMETWITVQQRLNKNEKPTQTGEIHFFSQKVYCEHCKRIFMRNVYRVKEEKTDKRAYLQCKGSRKYNDCNNNKSIRLDVLEEAIKTEINLQLIKFYDKNSLEKQYKKNKNIKNRYPDKIKSLEFEKARVEKQMNEKNNYYINLYEDKTRGIISEEEFVMLRKSYLQSIEDNKNRIQIIEDELKLLKIKMGQENETTNILEKYKRIDKLNKIIIDEFIDKIYIGKINNKIQTRDIIVEWNI